MESLKAITGAPRVPSEVCEVEYVPSPAFSPPSSSTFPPWHEALNAETLANEALANETLDGAAPFLATLRATTLLTAPAALKRTLLAELLLDSASCGGSWRAGDSFSIYAPNDERLVLALLARLAGGSGDAHRPALLRRRAAAVELPAHLARFAAAPARLGDILRWACDVSAAPRRQLLRALADHCGAALDRDRLLFLSSRQGAAAFGELRRQAPTTLDLLRAFPSCRPPAARLLELLPPLAPRAYSLCCAPGAGAGAGAAAWRFAFSVVDYCVDVPGAALRRRGVCTPWLELLPRGSRVLVARRRSAGAAFRLPPLAESRRPIIMVGPGTGVAPFVGFLEQRANEIDELNKVNDLNKSNELSKIDDLDKSNKSNELIEIKSTPLAWLFFGCRSSACDFLFRERLEQWRAEGVLGRLSTCFSRDAGAGPRYVQDAMAQHEEELMRLLLAEDALLFVCGDAKGMGRDVHAALAAMLCRHSAAHPALFGGAPLGPAQALELLARWASERRYLRDLWS
ncbi:hypothetical protein GGF38_001242 [Coemansia sp. RSA 25]|nr:hypothetical protein GGF38_001242 [Coemansia sp. RSA 25]